ncbi:hypothetical protein [Klebsiella oxytoca]|uniref:hypothetical protein n=1 Tax=Klebsiella oxytoca TaxID=571 RepID=UPI003F812DE8
MKDEDKNSEKKLKEEVLQHLRETLNQHRQLAEVDEPDTHEEEVSGSPEPVQTPKVVRKGAIKKPVGKSSHPSHRAHAKGWIVKGENVKVSRHSPPLDRSSTYSIKKPSVMIATAKQVSSLDPEQHRKQLNNRDLKAEIKLKKSYGKWFLIILAVQLAVMNGVFILDGAKKLDFEPLTLQLYMGGTLTEVFGLVLVVTKYLFKRK